MTATESLVARPAIWVEDTIKSLQNVRYDTVWDLEEWRTVAARVANKVRPLQTIHEADLPPTTPLQRVNSGIAYRTSSLDQQKLDLFEIDWGKRLKAVDLKGCGLAWLVLSIFIWR